MDLSDESGEIRATAWKEVAERLYNQIEVRGATSTRNPKARESQPPCVATDPRLLSILTARRPAAVPRAPACRAVRWATRT